MCQLSQKKDRTGKRVLENDILGERVHSLVVKLRSPKPTSSVRFGVGPHMKKFFILVVGVAVVIVGVFGYGFWHAAKDALKSKAGIYETTPVTVGTMAVVAEIADSDPLRIQGLSGRKNLPDGKGMLFIFPQSDFYGFWMKDMRFSIDIIGFDDTQTIVWLAPDLLPESFPTVFTPSRPVQYVLEVPAGSIEAFGLTLGETGSFE